jgi:hypothetical protein
MIRPTRVSVCVWLLVALWVTPVAAQVGLQVISPTQTAGPGDLVTLAFELTNTGSTTDTFEFTLLVPDGLRPLLAPQPLTLDAGKSEVIFLTIVVTPQAPAGENRVTLRAISTSDAAISAEATALILVEEVPGVEVVPPKEREVEPGETAELVFQVTNLGNTFDRLALMADSLRNFPLEVVPISLELLPGETRSARVLVSIPSSAGPGRERVTLTARSSIFGVEAAAAVTLTVLPPVPEAVGGSLVLEVPTALELAISGSPPDDFRITQGFRGDASFEEASEIDYALELRLADLTPDVRTLRFRLDRSRYGITLGDLTLPLTELVKMDGRGMRFTASAGPLSDSRVTLAAVLDSDAEIAIGGRAALGVDPLVPALSARFRPALLQTLADASLRLSLGDIGTWIFEGALSRDAIAGTADRALFLQSLLRFSGLRIDGEWVRAGSDFLGGRRDESGLLIRQTLNVGGVSVRSRFSRFEDNVSGDPARPTQIDTRVRTSVRLPLDPLPTLSAQLDFRSQTNPAPPQLVDTREVRTSLRISQPIGPLTLSATVDRRWSRDLLGGTDLERTLWQWDADLRTDPLLTLFRVGLTVERDRLTGEILDRALGTLVSATLRFPTVQLSLSVERLPGLTDLSARVEAQLGRIMITSLKDVTLTDTGEIRFSLNLSAELLFDLPIPFLPTKGRVEGFVFLDENGNGLRDPGEAGVSNLILSLDGASARTDPAGSGLYRFPPLPPGRYSLNIENLPANLVSRVPLPLSVELKAGEVAHVDLPLARISGIRGIVFSDADENGRLDPGEPGIEGVRLLASGPEGELRTAVTAADGTFQLAGLAPGRWRITLDVTTLPPRFEPTTPTEREIDLGPGETAEIAFGAVEVPPIVKFSPTADFTFEPESPKAGEAVTFDASASFDVDGQIVRYEWDFDGDGLTDAEGVTVTHIFEEPGEYSVTLTVTDDDDLTGSKTRTVTVLP